MKLLFSILVLLATTVAASAQPAWLAEVRPGVGPLSLVALLFRPVAGSGAVPGVIVLGGSEGGLNPAVTQEAKLVARHGYVALQLGYFGAPHLPETLQLVPLEYFEHAVAWLRAQPGVDPAHIGVIGTSIGGEAALLVAAHDPAIRAVVAAVPSNVVWQGLEGGITRSPAASFTLGGRPLPDLPYGWTGPMHDAYGRYAGGLAALPQHPDAAIPVEEIQGPVMLICGARDRVWPSCRMAAAVVTRLKAKGFRHAVTFLDFPRAGHAVFGAPVDPSSPEYEELGSLGGSAAANDAARRASWAAMLAFLDHTLKLQAASIGKGFSPAAPMSQTR